MFNALKKFLRILGPGVITGASEHEKTNSPLPGMQV